MENEEYWRMKLESFEVSLANTIRNCEGMIKDVNGLKQVLFPSEKVKYQKGKCGCE